MKKYKLVISDFHIGSGQLGVDGEVNPLESFIFDSRFIGFVEYYKDKKYKLANVELILNGDFLNTLQVDYREKYPTNISEEVAVEKVKKIFDGHPEIFDALKYFARTPNHTITYIVGNHDPAILFPRVREEINNRLDTEVNFPGFNYKFDGVWVEHGSQYTAANRFNPNRLFVKMKDGSEVLNLPWGAVWVIDYLNVVKKERPYIDRVQPFGRYLTFALIFDPFFAVPATIKLGAFFLRERFSNYRWKDPSEIRRTFHMLKQFSIVPRLSPEARKILSWPKYHTVIFGHNHQPAFRRYGKEKLYVNTGTWNDITHLEIQNLGRSRRLTYAFIDYPEDMDRPRVRLKVWKGTHLTEEDVIF
jgi:UDP-2,3-diacylglucosamine pyrophosphatase LpxH